MSKIDLRFLSDDFRNSQDQKQPAPAQPVPDGIYDVAVQKVYVTRSKTSGKPQLHWILEIMDSPYEGFTLLHCVPLSKASLLYPLKHDLKICGLTLQDINDLNHEDLLEQLEGIDLRVERKTNDQGFFSVYILERLDAPEDDGDLPEKSYAPPKKETGKTEKKWKRR